MAPTLKVGEHLAVEVDRSVPHVGDIVLFHPPAGADALPPRCGAEAEGAGTPRPCGVPTVSESTQIFVKRVVAGPGDRVAIRDGHVVRDGLTESEPYVALCGNDPLCNFPQPVVVPRDAYFVLGDNRGASDDSRFWGPVPRSWIIGRVVHCTLFQTSCHAIR
jgi:signal peptidase I